MRRSLGLGVRMPAADRANSLTRTFGFSLLFVDVGGFCSKKCKMRSFIRLFELE